MTHAEFRKMQALMDEAGLVTCIKTIRTGKKPIEKDNGRWKVQYRYSYRYEVIVNGNIIGNVKSRRTAKNRLIGLYDKKLKG
jgi:hypothetical protein